MFIILNLISIGADCLQNAPDLYKVKNTVIGNTITLGNHSMIFPNIAFKCDGYVTHWVHGLISQQPNNDMDSVQVQIWRPITQGDSEEGRYRLINSTSISVSIRSNSNIIIRQLSSSSIRPPLRVMKDDVVGVYQPSMTRSELLYNEYGGPDNRHVLVQPEGDIVNEANLKATCSDHYPLLSASFGEYLDTCMHQSLND